MTKRISGYVGIIPQRWRRLKLVLLRETPALNLPVFYAPKLLRYRYRQWLVMVRSNMNGPVIIARASLGKRTGRSSLFISESLT